MSLLGKTLAATYQGLLKLSTTDQQNFDGTVRNIVDGEDTASNLSLTDPSTGESILRVDGSHANGTQLRIDNSNAAGDQSIGFAINGTNQWVMGRDDSDNARFKIHYGAAFGTGVADANVLTLEHDGNVGIGLCESTARLHVRNDGADVTAMFESSDNDSKVYIRAGTASHQSILYLDVDSTDDSGGSIRYAHNATQDSQQMDFIVGDLANNAMRITGAGRVAIGVGTAVNTRAELTVSGGHATLPEYYIGEEVLGFTTTTAESGGGWSRGLNCVRRDNETSLGRIGFYGSGSNILTRCFIGEAHDDPSITIQQDTNRVGIGQLCTAPLASGLHIETNQGDNASYGQFMLEDTGEATHHQAAVSNSRQCWAAFCSRKLANYVGGGHFKFYCSNGWNELWIATTADVLWCQFYINSAGAFSQGHVINRGHDDDDEVAGSDLRSFSGYIQLTHDAAASNRATMQITNRAGSGEVLMWGYLRSYTGRMQIISGTYDE
tara:strand:+ start:623 stop:2104 length:1482 start_codon:yes stop_codon:yes gene_type:complete